jgi:hypothetical protein
LPDPTLRIGVYGGRGEKSSRTQCWRRLCRRGCKSVAREPKFHWGKRKRKKAEKEDFAHEEAKKQEIQLANCESK